MLFPSSDLEERLFLLFLLPLSHDVYGTPPTEIKTFYYPDLQNVISMQIPTASGANYRGAKNFSEKKRNYL
jgi:hypothetical protein